MNRITLVGQIKSEPIYSHSINGVHFYKFYFSVRRTSGYSDVIPCIAEQSIVNQVARTGTHKITGTIHSRKNGKHLELSVYVRSISLVFESDNNEIEITGVIAKKPVCRQTPSGRYIADMSVVSTRKNGRTDCIPCIVWSRNALYAGNLEVGQQIHIVGRFQSRQYDKNGTEMTAYEVSGNQIEVENGRLN